MTIQAQEIAFEAEGPQPLVRALPQGEPYPVAALGPLRGAVEAVQGMTLAPVAIAAQSALSVASLAVQAFADVETLGGSRPVSLYCLTIAASGERKSSCDTLLMRALYAHEKERAIARCADMDAFRNRHAIWSETRKTILNDVRSKKSEKRTEGQADLEALGREPSAPPSPDRIVTEPTFEGLTRMFFEGLPSLGIFSDEGGQFLGGHAMNTENRQKTVAAMNDAWQGNPIRRTRAGEGSYVLYGRRLALHLMVQPGVARDFLSDARTADMGFQARLLICEPPSAIGTRLQGDVRPDGGALSAFSFRLMEILETPMPMDPETRVLEPSTLALGDDARRLLVAYADETERAQADGGWLSRLTGTASKSAEQAVRIAGVLTLWADLDARDVRATTMADAIALARYYLSEAVRLSDAATVSAEVSRAETLRQWLLEKWPHPDVTLREMMQLGPNALREGPKLRAAVSTLESHGWLVPLEPGTFVRGAARSEAWRVCRAE